MKGTNSIKKIGILGILLGCLSGCSFDLSSSANSQPIASSSAEPFSSVPPASSTPVQEGDPLIFELNDDQASYTLTHNHLTAPASITIPSTYLGLPVTSIGFGAFWSCKFLEGIILPDSIISIGEYAFYRCPILRVVAISASVATIDGPVFSSCPLLDTILVDVRNPNFEADGRSLIDKKTGCLIAYANASGESYTFPPMLPRLVPRLSTFAGH